MPIYFPMLLLAAQIETQLPLLSFDLDASRLTIEVEGQTLSFALPEELSWSTWDGYVASLAGGADGTAARRIGESLFPPPCRDALATRPHWRVEDARMVGLDAVVAPWSGGEPLLATTRIDFEAHEAGQRALAVSRVLALTPFVTERFDPLDSPDTLQAAWQETVKQLQLLPRNDIDPMQLRQLLESERSALLSLRALATLPRGWALQWDAAPPARVWSWPGAAEFCDADAFAAQCAALSRGAAVLFVDRWPLNESQRASDYVASLQAMNRGDDAGTAITTRKRQLLEAGEPPRRWAGWVAMVDPSTRIDAEGPPWWQRWLRARRARSFGVDPR